MGVVLNVQQNALCFYLWAGTNLLNAWYAYRKTAYPQAALFAVYTGLAVWGITEW